MWRILQSLVWFDRGGAARTQRSALGGEQGSVAGMVVVSLVRRGSIGEAAQLQLQVSGRDRVPKRSEPLCCVCVSVV
jgi:hypothetical protein